MVMAIDGFKTKGEILYSTHKKPQDFGNKSKYCYAKYYTQ